MKKKIDVVRCRVCNAYVDSINPGAVSGLCKKHQSKYSKPLKRITRKR